MTMLYSFLVLFTLWLPVVNNSQPSPVQLVAVEHTTATIFEDLSGRVTVDNETFVFCVVGGDCTAQPHYAPAIYDATAQTVTVTLPNNRYTVITVYLGDLLQ